MLDTVLMCKASRVTVKARRLQGRGVHAGYRQTGLQAGTHVAGLSICAGCCCALQAAALPVLPVLEGSVPSARKSRASWRADLVRGMTCRPEMPGRLRDCTHGQVQQSR